MNWTIYNLALFVIGTLSTAGVFAWLFAKHYDKKHEAKSGSN